MDNQKNKLEKLKKTQKAKSRKDELFNSILFLKLCRQSLFEYLFVLRLQLHPFQNL